MAAENFARYKNCRTRKHITMFIRDNDFYYRKDTIFFSVVEYFVYSEKYRTRNFGKYIIKKNIGRQYEYELDKIKAKYPEYFI
jgi:hypothetical protein